LSLEWKTEGLMDGDSGDEGNDELVPWEADSRDRVTYDGKSSC